MSKKSSNKKKRRDHRMKQRVASETGSSAVTVEQQLSELLFYGSSELEREWLPKIKSNPLFGMLEYDSFLQKITTTPLEITSTISTWAKQITGEFPIYLDVGNSGEPSQCFINCVSHYVEKGGRLLPGWVIWESQYHSIAEHHCVIENDDGMLIDLTPQRGGERKILFVPDRRNAPPRLIDNEIEKYTNLVFPKNIPVREKVTFSNINIPAIVIFGNPTLDSETISVFKQLKNVLVTK